MNNQLKVQVALIIFIINVLVYYCILPDYRANSQESNKVESIPIESKSFKDQLSDIYCGKSNPPVNDCESALGLLKILETHCGIQKQTILFNKQTTETIATTTTATTTELNDTSSTESSLKLEKEVIIEETVAEIKSEDKPPVVEENLENVHLENIKEENTVSTEEVVTVKEHVPRQVKAKDEVGASNLIYQIIVVLLVVSVSASLADCIQERRKRRAVAMLSDPKNPANNGINRRNDPQMTRRMSLADLTMSRHARRESQASYRAPDNLPPPDNSSCSSNSNKIAISTAAVGMVRRSSSHESPRKSSSSTVCRQVSCPQQLLRRLSTVDLTLHLHQQKHQHHQHVLQHQDRLEDGGWAERRRVRMIQRH